MSDSERMLDLLDRALVQATGLVRSISADQMTLPTPCEEWDVQQLLTHMVSVIQGFQGVVAGEASQGSDDKAVEGDLCEAYVSGAAALVTAWRDDGAVDRTYPFFGSESPASMLINFQLTETAVHSSDLARATEQTGGLDAEVAEEALAFMRRMLTPEIRGAAFGQEVEVAAHGGPYERLAGFAGRKA